MRSANNPVLVALFTFPLRLRAEFKSPNSVHIGGRPNFPENYRRLDYLLQTAETTEAGVDCSRFLSKWFR